MINKTTRRVLAGMGVAAVVGLVSASDASAQTTANLSVTAEVVANCEIRVDTDVEFGAYDSLDAADLEGEGIIEVRCTQGAPGVTVSLGNGGNFSGGSRRMSGPGDLSYALYTDSGHTEEWIGSTEASYTAVTNGWGQLTVYGVVPAEQDVPVGSYSDSVLATVNF